jgi:hypothetical protein
MKWMTCHLKVIFTPLSKKEQIQHGSKIFIIASLYCNESFLHQFDKNALSPYPIHGTKDGIGGYLPPAACYF